MIFEQVFKNFEELIQKLLPEGFCIFYLSQKYMPGEYVIYLLLSKPRLHSYKLEEFLNQIMGEKGPPDWYKFYPSTGTLDRDIETYCFVLENQQEKELFSLNSLKINNGRCDYFDIVHKACNECFHTCDKNIDVTHLVGAKKNYLVGCLFFRFKISNPIDVHKEMETMNNLLLEHDINNSWGKIKLFKVEESNETWNDYDMICTFYLTHIIPASV